MLKYPFNFDTNTDPEKDLVTNPYKKGFHEGKDFRTSHRTAIFAQTDGVIALAESKIEEKTKGVRNWIANTRNDPYRVAVGKVFYERALRTEDYGNFVKINHGKNKEGKTVETLHAHLDEVVVFKDQAVIKGQLIGYADSTGNSTGNHLHTEIRINGRVVDPNTFDYTFEGTKESGKEMKFYPYDGPVDIRADIDYLKVRSGPSTSYKEAGSKKLTGGTKRITVKGYVEGEMVEAIINGEKVKTNLWWQSQFKNYFWCGGTDQQPTSDTINSSNNLAKGYKMIPEEKAKIEADLLNVQKRKAELVEELRVQEESERVLTEQLAMPVAEPVAEEVVDAPTPEPEVVDAEKEEAKSVIAMLKAKFNLE
jgi:hypothetical protein